MTLFMKYPSLTNHYAISAGTRGIYAHLNSQWYATEKIDGANVSVNIDLQTGRYTFAKRTELLDMDALEEPYTSLPEIITPEIVAGMAEKLRGLGYTTVAHVYGELFGAGVLTEQDYQVTTENRRDVILYDILVEDTRDDDSTLTELSLHDLHAVIPNAFAEKVIKTGTLISLLQQEPETTSLYGGLNEGYTYKLVDGITGFDRMSSYTAVKHKTPAFSERRKVKVPATRALTLNQLSMLSYITERRVANILSHGDIPAEMRSMRLLIPTLQEDVATEWLREVGADSGLTNAEALAEVKGLSRDITQTAKAGLVAYIASVTVV